MTAVLPRPTTAPAPPASRRRLRSLDLARGLTIAAMVVVNNQGSGKHAFPSTAHAGWMGVNGIPAEPVR